MLPICLLVISAVDDPAAIMANVAAKMEAAADARRLYVYQQKVKTSLVRSGGQIARRETREYSVIPAEKTTEKKLTSFTGEYRKGNAMLPYSKPGFKYKDVDIDGDLIDDVTNDLVNEKRSRDGIPHSLFPLQSKDLPKYKFNFLEEFMFEGRRTYKIGFQPAERHTCVNFGGEDDCDGGSWKGEAWVDADELQPVRIATDLAFKIPWGVRVFLGTNLRQTGFSIRYKRVAENVWFPSSYGTEFGFSVLWGYKRTVTMALESTGFQKVDVQSTVRFAEVKEEAK